MEDWINDGFKQLLDHRLRHPVRHRWHTQHAHPARLLRDGNAFHGRRKVASGTQTIPELVQVVAQILLKLPDRLLIDSRGPSIRFHTQIGFPDKRLGNVIRLGH